LISYVFLPLPHSPRLSQTDRHTGRQNCHSTYHPFMHTSHCKTGALKLGLHQSSKHAFMAFCKCIFQVIHLAEHSSGRWLHGTSANSQQQCSICMWLKMY